MITKPTVFILGAGASMPYGFPSGPEMKDFVVKNLNPDSQPNWYPKFKALGFDELDVFKFRNELGESPSNSIDEFIQYRNEFLEIGKLSICLSLFLKEDENNLNINSSWYKYLFRRLRTSFQDFDKNEVTILTFNYDRSFEFYLYKGLMKSYGKSDKECEEKMKNIQIIHAYGKIGALPWQEGVKKPYKPKYPSPENLLEISRKIVMGTEFENTRQILDCYPAFKNAEKIFFLGFGYHDSILSKLKLKMNARVTPEGTAYDLSGSERKETVKKWKISLCNPVYKTIDFLREDVPWIDLQA